MKYQDIELEVSNDTPLEYIDEKLGLNDLDLTKAVVEIYKEQYLNRNETKPKEPDDFVFSDCDLYGLNVGTCRYTIYMTGLVKEILHDLFIESICRLSLPKSIDLKYIVIKTLLKIQYVEDHQLCPFHQIVKWQRNHEYNTPFKVEDVFPGENCPYRKNLNSEFLDRWKCDFYKHEYCTIDLKQFKVLLDGLCGKDIIEPYEDGTYKFMF